MLEAKSISKRFGRTLALDGVNFAARPGEIHALLGENGAGKTTLMNVFAGAVRPDDGVASLDGKPLTPGSPDAALRVGIATVHQSPMLFERFTWEENLALGGFDRERGFGLRQINLQAVSAKARELASHLGFELPPAGAIIEPRSIAERVRLEVLRALSFNPRVLILDEPTGVLAPAELTAFLDLLRRLRSEGRIVILITHKLAEARAVADRITVLRDGRVVAETTPVQSSEAELARLMVGELMTAPAVQPPAVIGSTELLEIENLTYRNNGVIILDGVSLQLNAGEIAGVAGVDGNGQTELVEVLAGVRHASAGTFKVLGVASENLIAIIPQDRDLDGLILDMQLWENLLLAKPLRSRVSRNGWIDLARAREMCSEVLASFRISASGPEAKASSLSGGNRQRLELARALTQKPRVLVAHNVTRGLDLAATAEAHRTLIKFAADGGAVLLISSDLDELLAIATRLFVISRGKIRETDPRDRSPEKLGLMMAGRN